MTAPQDAMSVAIRASMGADSRRDGGAPDMRGYFTPWAGEDDCWECGGEATTTVQRIGGRGSMVPSCWYCADLREMRDRMRRP